MPSRSDVAGHGNGAKNPGRRKKPSQSATCRRFALGNRTGLEKHERHRRNRVLSNHGAAL
ncbi:hypothetical protein BIWAKO_06163 [Bosea sp. BIWAKO-01]|nr:hypothetical protein BIWAKO_06163 [Bosea sp. BIWAKO-01]